MKNKIYVIVDSTYFLYGNIRYDNLPKINIRNYNKVIKMNNNYFV